MLQYESPGQPELQEPPTNSVWVCTRGFFSMDRSALISGCSLELAEPRDVQGGELVCFGALCLSPELQRWVCGHKAAESEILSKRGFPPSCPIRLADGVSIPVAIDLQFFFPDPREAAALRPSMQFPAAPGEGPCPPPPADVLLEGRRWQPGQVSPWAWGAPSSAPGSGCQVGPFWLKFLRGQGQRGGVSQACMAFPSRVQDGEQARCLKPAEGEQGLLLPRSTW